MRTHCNSSREWLVHGTTRFTQRPAKQPRLTKKELEAQELCPIAMADTEWIKQHRMVTA